MTERKNEIHTNTAQLKRTDEKVEVVALRKRREKARETNERRSNNLNKPKNWKGKNEEKKTTTENNDVSSNWAVTLAICIHDARATVYFSFFAPLFFLFNEWKVLTSTMAVR